MSDSRILSAREFEVLDMLANGVPSTAIADKFGISRRTVEDHIAHVLNKLQARNRTHAVALLVKAGFINPHPTIGI